MGLCRWRFRGKGMGDVGVRKKDRLASARRNIYRISILMLFGSIGLGQWEESEVSSMLNKGRIEGTTRGGCSEGLELRVKARDLAVTMGRWS